MSHPHPVRLIFVYGTLMPAASGALGRRERGLLRQQARRLGPASVAARLYDLGAYPALVPETGEGAPRVHGEVLELATPDRTFPWLDAYEGVSPRGSARDAYLRSLLPVRMQSGATVPAWVYVARHLPAGAKPITSGRWLGA